MRPICFTQKVIVVFCHLALFCGLAITQKPAAAPRQEKLLNGLKVLVWNTPGADKVTLKLRIHSGSAFDPQEKEGVMALLSESFFPTQESRDYFTNELGGSVDVVCSHDYIQINARANASDHLALLETVAQAVSTVDLSKESTTALKTTLGRRLSTLESDPTYIADQAVARRLFGTFPYGRPSSGSSSSLQKIDFADLKFARERLLTAENATLALEGSLDPALTFRAVRRYFGAWLKADKSIPSTFRQPDPPERAAVKVEIPGIPATEVRYAIRGFSRSSKDLAAAEMLAAVLRSRFQEAVSKSGGTGASVEHIGHVLPGMFMFRYRSATPEMLVRPDRGDGNTNALFGRIYAYPVTDAEFATAKASVLSEFQRRDQLQAWLDLDTYKFVSVADDARAFETVGIEDVRSLASRLASEPVASAIVTAPPAAPVSN